MKSLRLTDSSKKSERLKDFKNTEIQLVFPCPLSSAVVLDEEHATFPQSLGQHSPFLSPVALSCQKMEPMDKHQRLIFTRVSREDGTQLVFLFSHIAFIFFKCAHCTLASGYGWYNCVFPPALWDHTYDSKGLAWPVSLVWDVQKELYVCISIPSLVVFFSNHKIIVHTCIVWLYWN